jgi:hypothetical protein
MRSFGVADRSPHGRLADPTGHRCEQDALGVQTVQDLLEATTALAHQPPALHRQVVVGDLTRGDCVAAELGDRGNVAVRGIQVDDEQAQSVESPPRIVGVGVVGPCQQQAHLGLQRLRCPDLATAHDEATFAVVDRARADARGVGAGIGFGHTERDVQIAGCGPGKKRPLQPVVAELHDGIQPEHREMQCRRPVHRRTGCRHAVEHDRALRDPSPATAVLLGNGDAEPPALGHRRVERPRELVALVARRPVRVVEVRAHPIDRVGNREVIGVGRELHGAQSCRHHRNSGPTCRWTQRSLRISGWVGAFGPRTADPVGHKSHD